MTQHPIQEQRTQRTQITVRLFAAAAHAAAAEEARIQLPEHARTLGDVVGSLPTLLRDPADHTADHPADRTSDASSDAPSLETVCARSSYLLNGRRVQDQHTHITSGDVLDVLPPFAGG